MTLKARVTSVEGAMAARLKDVRRMTYAELFEALVRDLSPMDEATRMMVARLRPGADAASSAWLDEVAALIHLNKERLGVEACATA